MNAYKQLRLSALSLILWALMPLGAAAAPPVQVTSADPPAAPQGTISLDVTVGGNGFDSTAQVKFLVTGTAIPGGITVKKVKVLGSKKLIATIDIADTAIVDKFDIEVALTSGRKGKGTSLFAVQPKTNNDPCAVAGLDFPAFAFWKSGGNGIEIFVADSTGKCSRSVLKSGTGIGGTVEFSYPVGGASNRGRVAWVEAPAVVGVDFTVDTATRQITVFAKTTIRTQAGGFISLSKNGNTMYSTRYLSSGGLVIDKQPLNSVGSPTGPATIVFQAPVGSNVQTISVNNTESYLFADYHPSPGAPTAPWQLVWIPLNGSNDIYEIVSHGAQKEFTPAAHPTLDLVVYQDYIPVELRVDGCDPLVIKEIGGATVPYPPPPAYGLKPTWMNGKVLADGRTNTCAYTGTIMQLDPSTGIQTALTSGYDPDGR